MRTTTLPLASVVLWLSLGCTCAQSKPRTDRGPGPASTAGGDGASRGTDGGGSGIAAGGLVKNRAGEAIVLECAKQAREVAGDSGTSWYVRCPPNCAGAGPVWGTDIYTDDSAVCPASIHAGGLDAARGGTVLVTWLGGAWTYIGSSRHGVASSEYGRWPRSFFVQSVDESGEPLSPPVPPLPANTARMSCSMAADTLPTGGVWRAICPPGCTGGSVWGSGPYTSDSALCRAAIHAGVATEAEGGEATVTFEGGQASFTGTAQNGVTTGSYGSYRSTFRVTR